MPCETSKIIRCPGSHSGMKFMNELTSYAVLRRKKKAHIHLTYGGIYVHYVDIYKIYLNMVLFPYRMFNTLTNVLVVLEYTNKEREKINIILCT